MELPAAFIEQLQGLMPEHYSALCQAITDTSPSTSVRVNVHRGVEPPAGAARVPWCPAGFYLPRREPFTFDPAFHSGLYYVQDASSMFLDHVLRSLVHEPVTYLDLCAAPGGKTTTALDALPPGSLVVANEIVPARARVLRDNVLKWGNPNAVVTCDSPQRIGQHLKHAFNVIAADVPCSGEGMMRKDDEAVAQWSPALVQQCAARQRSIIDDVWSALRPGGLLIYSTCTYNRAENEDMIEYIIATHGAQPVDVPIVPEWKITHAVDAHFTAYRFMPHLTRGEGLFMAVLRKPADVVPCRNERPAKDPSKPKRLPCDVSGYLAHPEDFAIVQRADDIVALPLEWAQEITGFHKQLNVLSSGITIATVKGKNCVPAHALALSSCVGAVAEARARVDYAQAMAYLRGEAIVVDAPAGYVSVCYNGAPLGWVKNLGSRANNLYPKSLRILSTHLPSVPPEVV